MHHAARQPRLVDDARTRGFDQIAILAAGMDARAFRLDSLAHATLFELDRDFVLAYKREKLGDAQPKCTRIEVPVEDMARTAGH